MERVHGMGQVDGMELVHGMGWVDGKVQAHDTLAHGGIARDDKVQVHGRLVHDTVVVGDDKELVHDDMDHVDGEQVHGAEEYGHLQVHVVRHHGSLVHVPPQKILNRLMLRGGGQSEPKKKKILVSIASFFYTPLTMTYLDHMLLVWWPL